MTVNAHDEDQANELAAEELRRHITNEIKYQIQEYETYDCEETAND